MTALAARWREAREFECGAFGFGKMIAACYAVTFGLSMRWAFQYLAWSVPFWLLAGRGCFAGATLLCNPHWPLWLVLVRNAAVVFFMAVTTIDLFRAARAALKPRR